VDIVGEKEAQRQRSNKKREVRDDIDGLVEGLQQKLELSEDHDNHNSNAIANAEPQEKNEGDRQTTPPRTPPTKPTEGTPLATEKELPTRYLEGSIEDGAADKDTAPRAQDVSDAVSEPDKGDLDAAKVASYTPIQAADVSATLKDGSRTEGDSNATK
jgi:hypothetical protein